MFFIEGKTKIITPLIPGTDIGLVTSSDVISAKDGDLKRLLPGKGELATRTTCNVFEFLGKRDVSLAYIGRGHSPNTFLMQVGTMILAEVVVRFVATGSYCKRNPDIANGTVLGTPVVEFFYKTSGCKVGSLDLPCNDPLMELHPSGKIFELYRPDVPKKEGHIGDFMPPDVEMSTFITRLDVCRRLAIDIGGHLKSGWEAIDGDLFDFKVEFTMLPSGEVVLGDVLDCDSWRVMWQGIQVSKQPFREHEPLDKVLGIYRLAAALTDKFVHL